jgi:hypothetical protein
LGGEGLTYDYTYIINILILFLACLVGEAITYFVLEIERERKVILIKLSLSFLISWITFTVLDTSTIPVAAYIGTTAWGSVAYIAEAVRSRTIGVHQNSVAHMKGMKDALQAAQDDFKKDAETCENLTEKGAYLKAAEKLGRHKSFLELSSLSDGKEKNRQ